MHAFVLLSPALPVGALTSVPSHAETLPPLTWGMALTLGLTSLVAGAINSVAGGGSFLTFPALIFCGLTPLRANATTTVSAWFGTLASVGAYRKQLGGQRRALITLTVTSLIGGLIGALLLLKTPDATFNHLLPWLMLTATVIFIFGKSLTEQLRRKIHLDINQPQSPAPFVIACVLQLIIAVYGGFFGGGIGIMMLALLALLGYEKIHAMNALKTVLSTVINGIAVAVFISARIVDWPQGLVMIAGSAAGGYGGAILAQRVPAQGIRNIVMAVGIGMTIYFFVRPK